jgi:hypothetical protein
VATASASASLIPLSHWYGITGASRPPWRSFPLRTARTISGRLQLPSPVAASGVRLAARTVPSRQVLNAIPPLSGPSGFRRSAAWQCPHTDTLRTMYSPRAASAACSAAGTGASFGSGTSPPPHAARVVMESSDTVEPSVGRVERAGWNVGRVIRASRRWFAAGPAPANVRRNRHAGQKWRNSSVSRIPAATGCDDSRRVASRSGTIYAGCAGHPDGEQRGSATSAEARPGTCSMASLCRSIILVRTTMEETNG